MENWTRFLLRAKPKKIFPDTLLALDPGGTTGFAVFRHGEFRTCGQVESDDEIDHMFRLHHLILNVNPDEIVCENYRIYASKSDVHINSEVPVARLIGAIQLSSILLPTRKPVVFQSAGSAKGFCTTANLKKWNLYQTAHRHSNDAIRHGCFYLLFGGEK